MFSLKQLLLLLFNVYLLNSSFCRALSNSQNIDYHSIDYARPFLEEYIKTLNSLANGYKGEIYTEFLENNHKCIHDHIKHQHSNDLLNINGQFDISNKNKEGQFNKRDTMSVNVRKQPIVTTHPIRIMFNTTYLSPNTEKSTCKFVGQKVRINFSNTMVTCRPQDILTNELIALITNIVLPFISSTFENFLTVTGPLYYPEQPFLQTAFCGRELFTIDVSNGFNADYMMYVTAHPIGVASVNAYATACLLDQGNNRPYAGHININPEVFSAFANLQYQRTHQTKWQLFLRASLHEAIHALGFSDDLFKYFIDRRTGRTYNTNINPMTLARGAAPSGSSYKVQRSFLATPNVLEIVRTHFDCDKMPGAELENNGGDGTRNSHWKATIFNTELMIGYGQAVAPLSNLTLALLYDSGWYGLINLDQAEPLRFGRAKGCSFALDSCGPSNWNYPGYWTDINNQRACTPTRDAVGVASWATYQQALPSHQQHWREKNVGSQRGDTFDYCLFSSVYDNLDSTYYCFDTNTKPMSAGEVFGKDSACILHFEGQSSKDKLIPACRVQRCIGTTLEVQVNEKWYKCPPGEKVRAGDIILMCPDATDQHCVPLRFSDTPSNHSAKKADNRGLSIDTEINLGIDGSFEPLNNINNLISLDKVLLTPSSSSANRSQIIIPLDIIILISFMVFLL
ncbi:hypothetical protein PPL_08583 [Heterostelium album PN500]|uniref:Leishmanolysin-like peptidase n=1 Tax=Heterostelium pallidum (strain ATCC 26659 / Pp 5 / PN500) TaxID=670386 RepID=D3BJ58_HETP5|nr:hypothetical protein PPL_08583 [Heterostelium album PN500]EFA77938.1 hypothetical protein PPL_08583 [Heterostelium album PN500]|eukprot:XP_020430066.1 hypothetical protein PPL_08583 [Heterostelium album PN500]